MSVAFVLGLVYSQATSKLPSAATPTTGVVWLVVVLVVALSATVTLLKRGEMEGASRSSSTSRRRRTLREERRSSMFVILAKHPGDDGSAQWGVPVRPGPC